MEVAARVAAGDRDPTLAGQLANLAAQAAQEEAQAAVQRLRETWTEWSPPGVPHVAARWTQRVLDPVDGLPEEQRVEVTCTACGAVYKRGCTSGLVKGHALRFAAVHVGCKAVGK